MMAPPKLDIYPPLLNSATPWATTADNLRGLLLSPHTGAVTVRTSLLEGFEHEDDLHRYLFFDPQTAVPAPGTSSGPEPPDGHAKAVTATASLNSLGYSPIPLPEYLEIIKSLADELPQITKTVILSITGAPDDIVKCYDAIHQASSTIRFPLAVEINLSCPNIRNSPPPAYDKSALASYLSALPASPDLPIGVKTPPYTHAGQYAALISALRTAAGKISFVTATNTLGSSLILDDGGAPILPGPGGLGGMAGPPLHPLALGNVLTIRVLLDQREELAHVDIIGIGGVSDGAGYTRMRTAGAVAVGVGTALGREGVAVFEKIETEIESKWDTGRAVCTHTPEHEDSQSDEQ